MNTKIYSIKYFDAITFNSHTDMNEVGILSFNH